VHKFPNYATSIRYSVHIIQVFLHRVSKKMCQLIFCSLSVIYEPISIKKLKDCPGRNPYRNCTEIAHFTWSMCLQYLRKSEVSDWAVNAIIKCIFKRLTEWQQAITWLAVIVSQKSHTCHITSFLLQYVLKMSTPARTQARRMLMQLDIITFNNRVTQSGPLAVDALFQFVDVRGLRTIDLLLLMLQKILNDFLVSQWFSEPACVTQHEFIVVNVQTTTSAFHKVV